MTRPRPAASVDDVRRADSGDDAARARRPFHVMTKPTGAVCNLDCEYCFFLSKEQLYPGSAAKWKRCHGAAAA